MQIERTRSERTRTEQMQIERTKSERTRAEETQVEPPVCSRGWAGCWQSDGADGLRGRLRGWAGCGAAHLQADFVGGVIYLSFSEHLCDWRVT
ncbi:hypothetical protein [Nonomuraea sp. NPDC049309]|uniref:hypothetical protein n=1 Tax=Nonomuraea sp. NPDC049309 TaxID=3364350 RepID=UPI00371123C9